MTNVLSLAALLLGALIWTRGARVIRPFFRWYDLWIGAYYDRREKVLYICPLPMIGIRVRL